jgi:MutS domain V
VATLTNDRTDRPSAFYARRTNELISDVDDKVSSLSFYGFSLAALGFCAIVVLYCVFISKVFPLLTLVPVAILAVFVIRQRHACQLRLMQLWNLAEYYEKGTARLNRKWESLDTGEVFADPNHFYSKDLDLFGQGSLFQLLCSARTQMGRETLANWMRAPASIEEIRDRQAAISELRDHRELPELLATAGPTQAFDCRPEFLKSWAAESSSPFPSWGRPLAFLLALAALALPFLFWFGFLDLHNLWVCAVSVLAIQGIFALAFRPQVKRVLESIGPLSVELPIVRELLEIVERERFSSMKLHALASALTREGSAASGKIRHLQKLMRLLKERDNEVFTYVSFCLLWGTQFTMAIEHWRLRHGAELQVWVAALGEFEALISLSTYSYEHPGDTLPLLLENSRELEAEGLGHPLLDEVSCVRNDVHLGDSVRFLIVSGSNMSGKSTFLRAIGLNVVLANMGAPVRCAKLRLSLLTIGAAIRIQDSVVDGRSHFLAEMLRLRRMIEMADESPLLVLADEIMSGTNSHDRRIATEWVVRALMLRGAIGAITTHDLALTEIATNGLPGQNVFFEDSGESGILSFDYKLRPGVLSRSNALNIAHLLGIDAAAVKPD